MLIGAVYRMRVHSHPACRRAAVFPTVEVVRPHLRTDRAGLRFPIPIDITEEDLKLAAGRQVRHAGDLPRRPAMRCRARSSRKIGLRPRRAKTPWPWPTDWDAPWRSSASAGDCRIKAMIHSSSSARRRFWLVRRSKPRRRRPSRAEEAKLPPLPPRRAAAIGTAIEPPSPRTKAVEPPPERVPLPAHGEEPATPDVNNLPPPPASMPSAQPGSTKADRWGRHSCLPGLSHSLWQTGMSAPPLHARACDNHETRRTD